MAIWKCFVISLKCKWYMGSRGKKGVATAHAPLKTSVEKAKNGQWEQEGVATAHVPLKTSVEKAKNGQWEQERGGYCPRLVEK